MERDTLLDASPLYVEKFGLSSDPFAEQAVPIEFIYRSTARTHQLNFLQHLCQFSQYILAVMGPEGSGKTTLKRQFIHEAKGQLKICDIRAQEVHTVPVLLEAIAAKFDLPWDLSTQNLDKAVADTLTQDWRPWVVVVDDAESLRPDVLEALLKLLRSHTMRGEPLHLVLLGEPALQNLLNLAPIADLCADILHRLDLETLDEQEMTSYVTFALQKAGFRGECPLSVENLHQIYQESKGLYSETNRLIRQHFMLGLRKPVASNGLKRFSPFSFKTQATWIAAMAILGVGFYMAGDNLQSWLTTDEQPTVTADLGHQATVIPVTEEAMVAATAALKSEQGTRHPQMEEGILEEAASTGDLPVETVNVASMPDTSLPALSFAEEAERVNALSDQAQTKLAEEALLEMPTTLASAQPTTEVQLPVLTKEAMVNTAEKAESIKTDTAKVAHKKNDTKANAKLAAKANKYSEKTAVTKSNAHRYTLQLMGLSDKTRLNQVIAGYHDKNLSYYETSRAGKPWYVVTYGDYADSKHAKLAADKLPAGLRESTPWARTFASIEKERHAH